MTTVMVTINYMRRISWSGQVSSTARHEHREEAGVTRADGRRVYRADVAAAVAPAAAAATAAEAN